MFRRGGRKQCQTKVWASWSERPGRPSVAPNFPAQKESPLVTPRYVQKCTKTAGFLNRSLSRAHRNKRSSPAFILLLDRRPRAEALTQDARTCDGTCHCVRLGGRGLRSCRSGRHVRREIIKRGNNLRRPWSKKIRNYCPTQRAIYVGGSSLSFVHLLTLAMPSSRHGLRQAIAPLLPAADFRISHPLDAHL